MRLCGLVSLVFCAGLIASYAADSTSARSDCTGKDARGVFIDFVQAFNKGNYLKLDSLFAEEPAFNWYSSNQPGKRLGAAAKARGTLIDYFRDRHSRQDRLRLVEFRFNGNWSGYGNFGFRVRRSAADHQGGGWFQVFGKGACVCTNESAKLVVISLGGPSDMAKGRQ